MAEAVAAEAQAHDGERPERIVDPRCANWLRGQRISVVAAISLFFPLEADQREEPFEHAVIGEDPAGVLTIACRKDERTVGIVVLLVQSGGRSRHIPDLQVWQRASKLAERPSVELPSARVLGSEVHIHYDR